MLHRTQQNTAVALAKTKMAIEFTYARRLEEIIQPAVDYLSHATGDLFVKQRIIVPTAGMKAWLLAELATRLGATASHDGIVANVDISYPKSIVQLLQSKRDRAADKWPVDRLTFEVLGEITKTDCYRSCITRAGGPLLAARAIADRFDRYHARRPAMIREWEKNVAALSPTASDEIRTTERGTPALATHDRWQFELWQAVRKKINTPSPPAREWIHEHGLQGLLVAGVQSLSMEQLRMLKHIGATCQVRVVFVHPSEPLQKLWEQELIPVTPGLTPLRGETEVPDTVDALVYAWLRGAHEAQTLLKSQGISVQTVTPTHTAPPALPTALPTTLLHRMQHTIAHSLLATSVAHDPTDRSFTIHRCHTIGRQVESAHDAILHAFNDLPDLQPHEVVIISPAIATAAPLLQATFSRPINANGRSMPLPLVIADRSIRDVNEGVDLLAKLLELIGSRCSVDDMRAVFSHPLICAHFGLNDERFEVWDRCVDRTEIRWGLTPDHRKRAGLPAGALDAHTWKMGLERMILGATLPDSSLRPALGGVVPLEDVALADIDTIATFIQLFDIVCGLDIATVCDRSVEVWCKTFENTMIALCGPECRLLDAPLGELEALRHVATEEPVPFQDVKTIVTNRLSAIAGRQPLRTGAITATSMIPLRGVPFRVVCVVGFDEGATRGGSEVEGDDLTERQRLLGDADPRLDLRRSLLDALLSARDRMIITCTGTSIKNNSVLPLCTPLAELVDCAVRHGVRRQDVSKPSGIEIVHPRHAISVANFLPDMVQPGVVWSHDKAAMTTAQCMGKPRDSIVSSAVPRPTTPVIALSTLEKLVQNPLKLFISDTLGINTWREDQVAIPATFPLALPAIKHRLLSSTLLELMLTGAEVEAEWEAALVSSGQLPVGAFGADALAEIKQLVHGIIEAAAEKNVPLIGGGCEDLRLSVGPFQIVGRLTRVHRDSRQIVMVFTDKLRENSSKSWSNVAGLHLLIAKAAGIHVENVAVLSRHDKWNLRVVENDGKPAPIAQLRVVRLAPEIDQAGAIARLSSLCQLACDAQAAPCGAFGESATKTLTDRSDGRKKFEQFVHGQNYHYSSEAVVYGTSPEFESVLGTDSLELAFRAKFDRQFSVAFKGKKKGYEVS